MDATDLDDVYLTCPYDVSHRILKSRMQWHLVRCRQNHPGDKSNMRTCPYDVTHVINALEYTYHVNNCPKSGTVVSFMETSDVQRPLGAVPLDVMKNVYVPPSSENWDNDPPAPAYDPVSAARQRGVLMGTVGLSKAKKKDFKMSERMRIKSLEENGIVHNPVPKSMREFDNNQPLRRPVSKPGSIMSEMESEAGSVAGSLRPPRTKPKAISVCSGSDYMQDVLNSSRPIESDEVSQKKFEDLLKEAQKISDARINQSTENDVKPSKKNATKLSSSSDSSTSTIENNSGKKSSNKNAKKKNNKSNASSSDEVDTLASQISDIELQMTKLMKAKERLMKQKAQLKTNGSLPTENGK